MDFTVKKNSLQKELGFLQGVVDKKITIPVLQTVHVVAGGGNTIEITATDLDITLITRCEAAVAKQGTALLPARKLFDVVRSLPEDDIRIKQDDGNWNVITCARSRFRLGGYSTGDFPSVATGNGSGIALSVAMMREMIGNVSFAITSEESQRYALSGAQMLYSPSGDAVRLVATDGHRLAYTLNTIDSDHADNARVLIPRKTLAMLAALLTDSNADTFTFARDDNHLFFDVDGRRLISRTLSGQFPAYETVLLKEINHTLTAQRRALTEAIKRVSLMADEKSRGVKLSFSPGQVAILANASEVGQGEETVALDYGGPEFAVGFNAQYLVDFLQHVDSETVLIEFKDTSSQAQFRPLYEGEGTAQRLDYRVVVMPMRI